MTASLTLCPSSFSFLPLFPEERGAGESVGQELGGALHHRCHLGRDAVPIEAVWGGRRGAGGVDGMEVEMGSKRQGRAGRWDFLSYFLSSVPVRG